MINDISKRIIFLIAKIRRQKFFLGMLGRGLKRNVNFHKWYFSAFFNLIPSARRERMLVIYDTSSQPFSVGDFLVFQIASLALHYEHKLKKIDIAFIYNPKNPANSDPVFIGTVTRDNIFFQLGSILPLAQINQFLDSVVIFSSHEKLQNYVADNIDYYQYVWPSGLRISAGNYLSPKVFNDVLYPFHRKYGFIPTLSCRDFLKDWASNFYSTHASGYVPVTINIRNNKSWHRNRNSQIDVWFDFFKYCHGLYQVKFIIICAHAEIDDRWEKLDNVVLAKKFHTTIEQDMALISTSAMHMGVASGSTAPAMFGTKPYLIINAVLEVGSFYYRSNMFEHLDKDIQRLWFSKPMQRIANGVETLKLLKREFGLMWDFIDKKKWQKSETQKKHKKNANFWLR